MSTTAPGWYKDPAEPTTQRYWDGDGWVGDALPADATPPVGPPPAKPVSGPKPAPVSDAPTRPTPRSEEASPPPQPSPPLQPGGRPQPGAQAGPPVPTWPAHWPPPGTQLPPGMPPPGYPIHPAYARLFTPAPRPHGYPLADVGRRLVARLVDIAILLVINAVVNGWFIYRLYAEFWPWYKEAFHLAQAHLPYDNLPQPQNTQGLAFTITLIAAALWFAYEVPAVANQGQTIGKRLLGIKVLRMEDDGPVGFSRALRRWNLMGVATLLWTCGIGFVLQFVDCLFVAVDRPLHQALHDKSAATVVVDVKHGRTGETR